MIEIPKEVYEALCIIENFCDLKKYCDVCPFNDSIYEDCALGNRNPGVYHHILLEQDGKYYARVEEENKRQLGERLYEEYNKRR